MDKRRPLRPLQVMENLPLNEGIDALPSGAASLEKRENLEKLRECRAAYSDLDYNGHVNNVRYIQWIQDSIQGELLESANRMRLDINYISEIKPGETTEIWFTPIAADNSENVPGSAFAFEGRKEDQGTASFRAELRLWRD
jgi:acyl-CoA thioesterase FadM